MKIQTYRERAGWLRAGITLGSIFLLTWSAAGVAAGETKQNDRSFLEKMEQWQDKMSEKFRDTWKSLRGDQKAKPDATASVDLREDKDSYTVRLNLPDRDLEKVEIKLEGDTLRIVAPAGDKGGRYEQTIALSGVASGAAPKIERKPKDNMIVVTVPKNTAVTEKQPSLSLPDPSLMPLSDWDRDVFARMEKMCRDMDHAFEEAFSEFRTSPEHQGFFDEPRFGSSLDLQDEGDHYVARAYLPDRDMKEISVSVEDRTLKIEAMEQATTRKGDQASPLHSTTKTAYTQLLTLPGPVQSDKMKVEKKEQMLVVTLPKAK
ncbi:MAG: Hsp20 family protein [Chthoniobacter sp.]